MKQYFIILISLIFSIHSFGETLTISDYCDSKLSSPKRVKSMTPLSDGETFAAISEDGNAIEVYSYKTGTKTGELFNIKDVKGDIKITDFSGFKVSDNGKKILLWNDVENIYRYSFTAEYYVYDTFRSRLAKVSEKGRQRCAVMSHDGRYVAYVRDNNIYISNLDYNTDLPITEDGEKNKIIYGAPDWSYEEEFNVLNTIKWNSDDTTLAFMRFDETDVPEYQFNQYRSFCSQDPLGDLYPSSYSYKYPLPGYSNAVVSAYSYNLDTKVTKKMDLPISYTDYVPSFEFDGEDKNLMVMILNHEQNKLSLYKVNPASTVSSLVYTESSDSWLSPSSYQMLSYDKNEFVIGSEKSGYRHLYIYDYNGNLKKQLTNGDFNVTDYYGKDNKGNHYIQSTYLSPINRTINCIDIKGNISCLEDKDGSYSASFSNNRDYCLLTYSSVTTPTQYRLVTSKGKKIADLELNEEYALKYASAPKMEFLKVKNAMGDEMNAYMIKPSNFNPSQKYPLLMYQYNGPESQEVLNRWRMEGIFYLASQGYIVACVDGRGTGNRTSEWTKCVYKQLGILETEDQIAGAEYFMSLPYIDSNKTACFGWSYGGYMTLMEMGKKGSPFKAGVAMASVSDWRFYDAPYTERFMQTPSQNPDGYLNSSPLTYTSNVKGRILLLSGTDDDNVHYYNSLKYASKISYEGGLVDMMSYAGFEHSLGMCNARVQLFRKILDFLNNNL